jgi:hypothetical protein
MFFDGEPASTRWGKPRAGFTGIALTAEAEPGAAPRASNRRPKPAEIDGIWRNPTLLKFEENTRIICFE